LTFIANYPPGLARLWLGTLVMSYLFVLVPWKRWTMQALVILFATSLVYIFPYADRFRAPEAQIATERFSAIQEWHTVGEAMINKGDYDPFQTFINSVMYVDRYGIMWGRNLIGAAFFWVPRAWWPDKPIGSGMQVTESLGYGDWNISAPLWMEAYLAFGTFGIIAILCAYGYVTGQLELRYVWQVRNQIGNGVLRWFVPFWAGYQTFFLRGDLMSGVTFCSVSLLVSALVATWRPATVTYLPAEDLPRPPRWPATP
jgi:hypothetical protein